MKFCRSFIQLSFNLYGIVQVVRQYTQPRVRCCGIGKSDISGHSFTVLCAVFDTTTSHLEHGDDET